MKIVVVDDDVKLNSLYEFAFSSAGIEVEIFNREGDALDYLRTDGGGVDAVLLDLSMPTLDGLTMAKEIRRNEHTDSREPPLHIAFLTGFDIQPPHLSVAKSENVERIFLKPIETDELIKEIQEWLT